MLLLLLTGLSLCGITGACNKKFLSLFGTVTSPSYSTSSTYAANLDCIFDIEVNQGKRIKLQWNSFDIVGTMPDCPTDYVEIFIGCKRHSIGRYCSSSFASKSFYTVYSPDNCLRLAFHSDGSGSGKGFSAKYTTYASGSALGGTCGLSTKRLTADSGVIISPGWPVRYPPRQDCYWKIELGQDKSVKIAFMDFDLEFESGCDRDKVKVKGGDTGDSYDNSDTVKSSTCGSQSPFSLTSSKDVVWIRFKTDSFNSNHGFVAGYVLYDSKEVESTAGVVVGIVVVVGVIAVIAGIVCFIVFYQRKRVRMAQRHVQQATVMSSVTHQSQAPAPYTYPPPPPQPSHVPPPYNQAVTAPYPKQAYADAPTPYPPEHYGGAPHYPTVHHGDAPPYPTGHPGDAPPYPTGHPGDAPPYPTGHPGDAPPYPPGQPGGGFPYPPGPSASAPSPYPPGPVPYPPEGYPSKPPLA